MLTDNVITLRAPEPADVDAMYLIENDTSLWDDGVTFAPLSHKQLWDYVDSYDGNIFASCQLRFVIWSESDDCVVGLIDLYDYDRINHRAYTGITVARSWRGKGIGGRALSILCRYCRDRLGMMQLAAVVRADNSPSRTMFERHGFNATGHFPAWIHRGNQWVDAIHYQKLLDNR